MAPAAKPTRPFRSSIFLSRHPHDLFRYMPPLYVTYSRCPMHPSSCPARPSHMCTLFGFFLAPQLFPCRSNLSIGLLNGFLSVFPSPPSLLCRHARSQPVLREPPLRQVDPARDPQPRLQGQVDPAPHQEPRLQGTLDGPPDPQPQLLRGPPPPQHGPHRLAALMSHPRLLPSSPPNSRNRVPRGSSRSTITMRSGGTSNATRSCEKGTRSAHHHRGGEVA